MGLDITAFSKLSYERPYPQTDDEWGEYENDPRNLTTLYPNSDFPEQADGLERGLYSHPPTAKRIGFRAGSYGGYNGWRARLCMFAFNVEPNDVWANPSRYEGKPFYELINFADNEGTIGAKTSAKLAADFDSFNEAARKNFADYDYELYVLWQQAFHIAADEGAVSFH